MKKAISSLKRDKSSGIDNLKAEMFIDGKDIVSPMLCKLFNHLYTNCIYPDSWTKGVIVPIPKKGDLNDANNYRGITLTSIFSKIFSILLDNRLRDWSEKSNILTDYQYGFRKGKSTTDCIFVLNSIIDKVIKQEKKKLYCSFIDFRKAFDVVYRNGIWLKMLKYGISNKFTNMLQKIYEKVRCVKVQGCKTDFFESKSGVKQGEPLSPLLFLFFINDVYDSLCNDNFNCFTLEEQKLFLLLFADDMVLFSYTVDGLQSLLNKLHAYCNMWGITVNVEKTVAMVFKKGNTPENISVKYNDIPLNLVKKFTYLGVTLSSNGSFYQAQKSLSQQANRALYGLNSLFDSIQIDIPEKLKLFDSMISPILNYSSSVWGFHKAPDIERVHLKFLKQLLKVKQKTANAAIYGELGRVPMQVIRKTRILKFWFNIVKNPDSLQFKLFNLKDQSGNQINAWAKQVKQVIDNLGFSYLWMNDNVTQLQLDSMIRSIYDQFYQQWFSDLRKSSKLETYCLIKTNFERESYLEQVTTIKHRTALAKFRCSSHMLLIEEGRYRNIPREQRLCSKCNMTEIETEYHFLLVCPYYREIRTNIYPNITVTGQVLINSRAYSAQRTAIL